MRRSSGGSGDRRRHLGDPAERVRLHEPVAGAISRLVRRQVNGGGSCRAGLPVVALRDFTGVFAGDHFDDIFVPRTFFATLAQSSKKSAEERRMRLFVPALVAMPWSHCVLFTRSCFETGT